MLDSRCPFATVHVYGSVYQERGLLTAKGKTIKNKKEIFALLEVLWLPLKVAIIHCPGHQNGTSEIAWGDRLANKAKREATQASIAHTPVTLSALALSAVFRYTSEDKQDQAKCQEIYRREGCCILPKSAPSCKEFAKQLIHQIHQALHLDHQKLKELLQGAKYNIFDLGHLVAPLARLWTPQASVKELWKPESEANNQRAIGK